MNKAKIIKNATKGTLTLPDIAPGKGWGNQHLSIPVGETIDLTVYGLEHTSRAASIDQAVSLGLVKVCEEFSAKAVKQSEEPAPVDIPPDVVQEDLPEAELQKVLDKGNESLERVELPNGEISAVEVTQEEIEPALVEEPETVQI